MARIVSASLALASAAAAFDCSFNSTIPRQHIAYHMDRDLVMDGKLDDPEWEAVGFTEDFVDIATNITPQFRTRAKIRWSDNFLYVGALVEVRLWHELWPPSLLCSLGCYYRTRPSGQTSRTPAVSELFRCLRCDNCIATTMAFFRQIASTTHRTKLFSVRLRRPSAVMWLVHACPPVPVVCAADDNDFEVFVDPGQTTHYYKEVRGGEAALFRGLEPLPWFRAAARRSPLPSVCSTR